MKLNSKQMFYIIIGIGLLFVAFGLAQAVFNLKVDESVVKNFSTVLFIVAAGLFFYMKKLRKTEAEEKSLNQTSLDETDKIDS